jgi:hypothetical protein
MIPNVRVLRMADEKLGVNARLRFNSKSTAATASARLQAIGGVL